MNLVLAAPEWLFLVPALVALGWRAKALRLGEPLRVAALALIVLALADPQIRVGGGGLDLWVLVDRSDSAASLAAGQSGEVAAILEKSRRRDDRVYYVDYAVDAQRRDQGDPVLRGGTGATNTAGALDFALGQMGAGRPARLLVLSDGFATEPLGEVAEKILRRGVPLDYRLLGQGAADDVRVAAIETPARVLPGEAFLVEFSLVGRGDAEVPWEVWRGGDKPAASGVARLKNGSARVRLTDRLGGSGAVRYEVRIRPAADAHPENNLAASWVEVAGGGRVLLVTNYPDDPLARLLGAQGLRVQVVERPGELDAASLTGARLVVLNNVPAHRVGSGFLAGLDYFVREQGGGLLMIGGENSFGSGGYFSSAVDPLLPVSMELRKEHRKLATAMAVVLDRSGSMAASAGGGQTKMDLANTGTARAIELLGNFDAVSVHAVDSAPHEIVALAQVGPNRERMLQSVRRIVSSGGGIYVYQGLKAGWEQLKRAETGQRHLVLFSDAADSEEPGDYVNLLAEMRAAGVTVSVIGLGTEKDVDAEFLKDVAAKGGGRIFFTKDAAELPAIFAQETVSVARSAFIKEPTGAAGTPGWIEIAARAPKWPESVDAYNLSYLREGATASLVTTDEYQAPLVAAWARGAGRAAAVSFPMGGAYSTKARSWPDYGDFAQTIGRWLAGEDVPPGLAVRTEVQGEVLFVELLHDESWTGRIAQTPPLATMATGKGEPVRALVWEKIEPGLFRASARLTPGEPARGVVRVGAAALPFGPVAATGSAEWSYDRDALRALRELANRSGGGERLELGAVWEAPRRVEARSLRAWWLGLLAALLVAEAAVARLDLRRARRWVWWRA
jgi:hypothetical protein